MNITHPAKPIFSKRRSILVRALLVFVCLVAVVAGTGIWKLTHGGIPVDFLKPRLEQAFESRLPFQRIDIGAARLEWDMEASTMLLRLQDTRISAENGTPLAAFSSLLLGMKPWDLLLHRQVRLTHVVLVGGFIGIERKSDGSFDFNVARTFGGVGDDALARAAPDIQLAEQLAEDIFAFASPAILPEIVGELTQSMEILESLETLEIRGAGFLFRDSKSGLRLRMNNLRLKLHRAGQGVRWEISSHVGTGGGNWNLLAAGRQNLASLRADVDVRFERIGGASADSGRMRAHFDADLRRVVVDEMVLSVGENQIALNGSVEFFGDRSHRIELQGENLVVHIGGITQSSVPVDRLFLRGNLFLSGMDLFDTQFEIETLRLELPAHNVDISGSVRAAPRSPELRISIVSEELQKDDLMALWPVPLETFTREWVAEHIISARLENILIRMNMGGGDLADVLVEEKPLPEDSLLIQTDLYDVVLDYLPPFPEIKDANGGLRIQDSRFEAWADNAKVKPSDDTPDIDLQDLRFAVDQIYVKDPPSRTSLSFQGEASALFFLLQSDAIGLRQKDAGIDALRSEGVISGDLSVNMRLYDDIEAHHVDLVVDARGKELLLPLSKEGYQLSQADIHFTGSLKEMRAEGQARVNGVKITLDLYKQFAFLGEDVLSIDIGGVFDETQIESLGMELPVAVAGGIPTSLNLLGDENGIREGRMRMDLTPVAFEEALIGWNKPREQAASLDMHFEFSDEESMEVSDFFLQSEDVEVRGGFRLDADDRVVEANLSTVRVGADTFLKVHARRGASGVFTLDISGDSLDIRYIIDNVLGGEGLLSDGGEGEGEDGEDSDNGEEVITRGRIKRLLSHDGVELRNAVFYLHQSGDHVVASQLDAELGEAHLHLHLDTPAGGEGRKLTVSSGDGGAILKGLDLYPHVAKGELSVEADLSPIGEPLEIRGRITGGSFRVLNAPAFARLLTLASLSGIEELLSQSGIFFQDLNLPFMMSSEEIRLLDGEMNGPSLGLTLRGSIDRPAKHVDLQGTLVPSYTLNSLLGNIPVLGELIIGRQGEGIFGITFLVKGPVEDVDIVANPLSFLTPGFLRRFIEFGENETDTLDIKPLSRRP